MHTRGRLFEKNKITRCNLGIGIGCNLGMQSGDRYRGFFVIHKEIIPIEKVNYSEKLNSQDPIIGFPIAYFPFCYFAVFLFFKPLAFFHQPLFLSIPLAKAYGGTGAAIGTAISLLIGNGLVMNWYYH